MAIIDICRRCGNRETHDGIVPSNQCVRCDQYDDMMQLVRPNRREALTKTAAEAILHVDNPYVRSIIWDLVNAMNGGDDGRSA